MLFCVEAFSHSRQITLRKMPPFFRRSVTSKAHPFIFAICALIAFSINHNPAHISTTRWFPARLSARRLAGHGIATFQLLLGTCRRPLADITRSATCCRSHFASIRDICPEFTAGAWSTIFYVWSSHLPPVLACQSLLGVVSGSVGACLILPLRCAGPPCMLLSSLLDGRR